MTYEIKIVPDICCMETSERVLTTGVESFQNTAMKTGSFLLRWHNFPLKWRHRGQEDPAAARIHGKPFRKKEKKKKNNPTTWGTNIVPKSETLCCFDRFPAILQAGGGEEEVRVWKEEKHVRPHEAALAFSATIICRFNTPTRSHLTGINAARPSVYSDWQDNHFHASSADRTKGWNKFISYSSHSCSIWLVCVLCCSKRFHYDRLELQQFFFFLLTR